MRSLSPLSFLGLVFLVACSSSSATPRDAGGVDETDGAVEVDAGPDAGAAADGGADAGDLDAGDSDAGDLDAGDSDAGDSDAGDSDAGNLDAGNSDAGDLDAGDLDAGDSDAGDSDAGDSDGGVDGGGALCDAVACAARGEIRCDGDTLVEVVGACAGDTCRVTTTRTECTGATAARCFSDNTYENDSGFCDDSGATPVCGTHTLSGSCGVGSCGCTDGACDPWDIDAQVCTISAGVAGCSRQIFTCDAPARTCTGSSISHTEAMCVPGSGVLPSCSYLTTTTSCAQPHCVIEDRGGVSVHVSRVCSACGASGDCTGCTETDCGSVGSCDTATGACS